MVFSPEMLQEPMRRACLPCAAFLLFAPLCKAADLQEIIRRGTAIIQSDWAADSDYSYVQREEFQKSGQPASKTTRVVMLDGSEYSLPLAVNDEPLSADATRNELTKLKAELERRRQESASARRQRVEKFKKQEDENGALLLNAPNAFTFEFLREETRDGYPAYVLSATPNKRTGPMTRAAKVLSGMHVTLWIERDTFHVIRGEAEAVIPVPVYGILAKVLPGTHIAIRLAPVTDSVWLIGELSMNLSVSKLFMFKSTESTRTTYTDYRSNDAELKELLLQAGP
jgi:hypothetical protein